jgi:hypothetical protein
VGGFIKDYLERAVNPAAIADGFLKAIGGAPSLDGAIGKLDGLAAARRKTLTGEQKQYADALQKEEKRIETEMRKEAQAAAAGGLPSLPGGLRPR